MRLHRPAGWVLLALVAGLVWSALSLQAAQAHAVLVRSLPEADAELAQPPARIELWFSEPLEAGFSTARLLTSSGQDAPGGAVMIDPADSTHMTLPLSGLEPGLYTVAWQTLSQVDGHEFAGSFPITVLNPDGSRPTGEPAPAGGAGREELPTAAEALARWCWLLGGAVLFGAPVFQLSAAPASRIAGRSDPGLHAAGEWDPGLLAVWIAALAVTAGQVWQLSLQAGRLGGPSQLADLLLGTRLGALMLARQALVFTLLFASLLLPQPKPVAGRERLALYALAAANALALGLLAAAALRGEPLIGVLAMASAVLGIGWTFWKSGQDGPAIVSHTWRLLAGLAGGLLLAISVGSHAGAGAGSLWAVLGDFIHLAAAGVWAGGLLLLTATLWQMRHSQDMQRAVQQRALLELIRRFSYLASLAVFMLVLTGVFNSLVEIPRLADLWATAYGRVLLVKLGLVGLALGIAFLNNRLVHVEAARHKEFDLLPRLSRQVAGEVCLVLGLMLSVAVLVQTPAPRGQTPTNDAPPTTLPFTTVVSGDDLYMHIQVDPNQAGSNRFWLHLYHADGSPIGEVQLVQLHFTYRDLQLGQARADLEPLGLDTFSVEGAYLSQAGAWDVSAYIRRRGLDDSLLQFSLDVPPPAGNTAGSDPLQNPIPNLPAAGLAILVLLGFGAIPVVWRRPLQAAWPKAYRWLRGALFWLVLPGLLFCLVRLIVGWTSLPASPPLENPFQATAASLEQGEALYGENCLLCHGPSGKGDGPAALTLNPRPANLQVHVVPGAHSDAQLFDWITNGYPGTAMPAFGETLTEEQRWHVVNYIRTFANP